MESVEPLRSVGNSGALETEDELEEKLHGKTGFFRHIRIAENEWPRVLHMSSLFGLLTLVHNTMGNLKDMVLMGRQGPMSMFLIKSIFLPPCSLFLVWLIQIGLGMFSPSRMFDITIVVFALCYSVFGLVLWPCKAYIQKDFCWARDIFCDGKMQTIRLQFTYPLFLVFNEWTSSFLFLCSEMWGALVVSYFFNVFTNETSTRRQSQRYISVYTIFNAFSILGSSLTTLVFNEWRNSVTFEQKELGLRILVMLLVFVIAGTLTYKKHIEKNVLPNPIFLNESTKKARVKSETTLGQDKSIMKSKLLIAISSNILFYGISSTLIEATFKSGLAAGAKYTNSSRETYSNFYNSAEQFITSISSLIIVNTPFPLLVRKGRWGYVASLPILGVMLSFLSVFPMAFYNLASDQDGNVFFRSIFRETKPNFFLENNLGLASTAFLKVGKYLGSDITKEAISMQIDPIYRAKYKAIYDGLCGKLGKSIGSILCMIMSAIWDVYDIRKLALVSGIVVAIICVFWICSVIYLNRKYQSAIDSNSYIDIDEFGSRPRSQK